jgi:hypothetical protein
MRTPASQSAPRPAAASVPLLPRQPFRRRSPAASGCLPDGTANGSTEASDDAFLLRLVVWLADVSAEAAATRSEVASFAPLSATSQTAPPAQIRPVVGRALR